MKHLITYSVEKSKLLPLLILPLVFIFSSCVADGDKTANLSAVYALTAIAAFIVLICYFLFIRKKDAWYTVLFTSVVVVNLGYWLISVSDSLSGALAANRLAYLGSVFLPLSMLMIILKTVGINCKKGVVSALLTLSCFVFLIAASQGILSIYYKDVSLEIVDGFSTLKKVYGPLHIVNLIYLLGYFVATVWFIVLAKSQKRLKNTGHSVMLMLAVFVNIGVWLIEQMVQIGFEVLAFSYIISELFLLALNVMLAEQGEQAVKTTASPSASSTASLFSEECLLAYKNGLAELTKTERIIYDAYVGGKCTKEIMAELNIKENTLKFHNKNIYSKLGVSSRKQLIEISKSI